MIMCGVTKTAISILRVLHNIMINKILIKYFVENCEEKNLM